jgi:hypothetical protein
VTSRGLGFAPQPLETDRFARDGSDLGQGPLDVEPDIVNYQLTRGCLRPSRMLHGPSELPA